MHSLPIFLDMTGRPVVVIGDGAMAAAKRRLIERAGAVPVGEGDSDGDARIGFVALDDDEHAAAAAARLKARGLLVNVADRPALCDFTLPAIIDRDPVILAIGTGGRSAGLAKALRQRLETMLPARLGSLADHLFAARSQLRTRWPDADARRRAIDDGLAEGGPLDPLRDGSESAVEVWAGGEQQPVQDRLVIMCLHSTDPDDLTLGQARLLGQADRIFHRADVPAAILDRARADASRMCCAAAPTMPGPGLSIDLGIA